MRLNHLTKIASLVAAALAIVAVTPAISRAQPPSRQCVDDTNCPAQSLSREIVGEPMLQPQPETPVQLDPGLSSVQPLPEEITFEPSVRTVLRVLNDLGSGATLLN